MTVRPWALWGLVAVGIAIVALLAVIAYALLSGDDGPEAEVARITQTATASPTATALLPPSPQPCTERDAVSRTAPSIVRILGATVQGSGVVIDQRGYVLTNSHVVERDRSVMVALSDGRELSGQVWSLASDVDLAVVRVEGSGFRAAKWGDSNALRPSDTLIAIGYPLADVLGGEPSVTTGTLSAHRSDVYAEWLQTDVALNPGSSGGAVVDICGELVGISTGALRDTEGMNFAIASATARPVAEQLIQQQVRRGVPTPAAPDQPQLSPEQTAWAFYYFVANREFVAAYSLLSQRFQAIRPYETWLAGYDTTLFVFVEEVKTVQYDPPVVYVSVLATDLLDKQLVTRRFAGNWEFALEDGFWRLDIGRIAVVP